MPIRNDDLAHTCLRDHLSRSYLIHDGDRADMLALEFTDGSVAWITPGKGITWPDPDGIDVRNTRTAALERRITELENELWNLKHPTASALPTTDGPYAHKGTQAY